MQRQARKGDVRCFPSPQRRALYFVYVPLIAVGDTVNLLHNIIHNPSTIIHIASRARSCLMIHVV